MAADYQQTFETDPTSTIFDEGVGSIAAIATDQFHQGTHSLKFHQVGSSSAAKRTLTNDQVGVHRFWFRYSAAPAANEQVLAIFDTPTGTSMATFVLRSTGNMSIGIGNNPVTASVISANAWHSIDLRFDSSGTSWTVDWNVDGVAQTQAVLTGKTATSQGSAQWCKTGANTFDWWIDEWQYSHVLGDYPLADISSGSALDAGALSVSGSGNIAIASTRQGFLAGALSIAGAGSILVSQADLAHFTGALTIPGTGNIVLASTRQGFLAGALAINGAGTINTAGISSGGNVVVGSLSLAGSGLITVTAAQLAQLLGALSIVGIGDIEAAFAADPNAPIIITRLDDADFDPNFTPYFF